MASVSVERFSTTTVVGLNIARFAEVTVAYTVSVGVTV